MYAYTSSPVARAILELFARCDCTLPNLFVGTLCRCGGAGGGEGAVGQGRGFKGRRFRGRGFRGRRFRGRGFRGRGFRGRGFRGRGNSYRVR